MRQGDDSEDAAKDAAKDVPADAPKDAPRAGPKGGAGSSGAERAELPAPTFSLLCMSLAAQAQVSLGLHEHPITHKTEVDLRAARHAVGMLEMLEAKTKANLEAEEAKLLAGVLYGLRMAFVKATTGR